MPRKKKPVVPKRPAAVVKQDFEFYREEARKYGWDTKLNCHEREDEFALFERRPKVEAAEALCAGCPLRTLCREFGEATKPGWGVWGGRVWVYGRPIRKKDDREVEAAEMLAIGPAPSRQAIAA